eukprot:m.1485445 g.1485445  ORF g.1485445 m.1485445 type:complete len:349 (-) comp25182_c0_seq6:3201-4247(-)
MLQKTKQKPIGGRAQPSIPCAAGSSHTAGSSVRKVVVLLLLIVIVVAARAVWRVGACRERLAQLPRRVPRGSRRIRLFRVHTRCRHALALGVEGAAHVRVDIGAPHVLPQEPRSICSARRAVGSKLVLPCARRRLIRLGGHRVRGSAHDRGNLSFDGPIRQPHRLSLVAHGRRREEVVHVPRVLVVQDGAHLLLPLERSRPRAQHWRCRTAGVGSRCRVPAGRRRRCSRCLCFVHAGRPSHVLRTALCGGASRPERTRHRVPHQLTATARGLAHRVGQPSALSQRPRVVVVTVAVITVADVAVVVVRAAGRRDSCRWLRWRRWRRTGRRSRSGVALRGAGGGGIGSRA